MTQLPDGSIEWGALSKSDIAERFDIRERQRVLYDWIRVIRGGIVSGAFSIERNFDGIISVFYLRQNHEVFEHFRSELLVPITFDRKLSIVCSILRILRDEQTSKAFGKEVRKFQVLRNAMAHRPFWLDPLTDAEKRIVDLKPMIRVGKQEKHVNRGFVNETNALIRTLIEATGQFGAQLATAHENDTAEEPVFLFESFVGMRGTEED